MGNQSMRGRNGGNFSRGIPSSQISAGERSYYDQMPPSYSNQSQYYYHQHNSQAIPPPLHIGLSYQNNRQQPSSETQPRLNSNRTNNNRNYRDDQSSKNDKRLTSTTSNSSHDINSNTISSGILIREHK
jgi:hypothetical protein